MSTIRRLIAELKSGMLPGAKDIEDLAYVLHSAMLDAPEMTWMPITFEDMGDAMHKAIECAEKNETIAEAEAKFDNELDRGQELYEDRMAA